MSNEAAPAPALLRVCGGAVARACPHTAHGVWWVGLLQALRVLGRKLVLQAAMAWNNQAAHKVPKLLCESRHVSSSAHGDERHGHDDSCQRA